MQFQKIMKLVAFELMAFVFSFLSIAFGKVDMDNIGLFFYKRKVWAKLQMLRIICCDTLERYTSSEYQKEMLKKQGTIPPDIYVLWLQGREAAPELVKTCIEQMESLEGYTIKILNQNIIESLPLDPIFFKKYHKGYISRTHLSDVIRLFLLSHKGGIWCDSTLLVYNLPDEMCGMPFYSVRRIVNRDKDKYNPAILNTGSGALAPWTSYFIASSKNCIVTSFAYDALVEYYNKCSRLIDYFLIDFVFRLGYEDIPVIRKEIDNISINNNGHIHDMFQRLNDGFDQTIWNALCDGSSANMFKLSYKAFETKGHETFWDYIRLNVKNKNEYR